MAPPARSSAASVFSKVAGAGLPAMRSTSARFSAMAASSAGWKCSTRTRSKGGMPPYGPVHAASSGLAAGLCAVAAPAHTTASTAAPNKEW